MPSSQNHDTKRANQQAYKDRIAEAVAALPHALAQNSKLRKRAHARKFNVDHRRFGHALDSHPCRSQVDQERADISPEAARLLIEYIVTQSDRGFPLTYIQIAEAANYLVWKMDNCAADWIGHGKDWAERFVRQYLKELATYWTKSHETVRANGLTEDHVNNWFELLTEVIVGRDIPASHCFMMDESGFQLSCVSSKYCCPTTDLCSLQCAVEAQGCWWQEQRQKEESSAYAEQPQPRDCHRHNCSCRRRHSPAPKYYLQGLQYINYMDSKRRDGCPVGLYSTTLDAIIEY